MLDEEAVPGGRRVDDDGRDLAVLELKAELGPKCYKTFRAVIFKLECLTMKRPFQPCLMFVGKSRSLL